ncbi:MAG: LysR family transcriptional regulator [Methylobacteriaceae bacterium]|nr:LysR family transcriptional regulator [Methylobacteriaceae bacterium]
MAFLNYHHLRYFWVIASEGSLTRAAERLAVSASSLSVQLQALEAQLGHQLFERRGRKLELTEAGRIALDYAGTVFRSGEELLNTLKGLRREGVQVLRVGAIATLSRNFQIELIRPLVVRDDVELVIRTGALPDLLAGLESHALDLVLANQPAPADQDVDWQNDLVTDQAVSLVGHPPPDGAAPFRFPRDLDRAPLVVPAGSTWRIAFERLCQEAGVAPRIVAEIDDMAMLRLVARESRALTLVPPVVVRDELASGLLVERCRVEAIREAFYAISRRRRFPHPLVADLLRR